jgi:hypothetical protein
MDAGTLNEREYVPLQPEPCRLAALPYFRDPFGVNVIYGPPRSGKTTVCKRIVDLLTKKINFYAIVIFCPGTRSAWAGVQKKNPRKTIMVSRDEEECMKEIVKNQQARSKAKQNSKLLLIWDDQVGSSSMHEGVMRTMCKKFAACGRQEENQVCWLVCAQTPTFCNPTVRQSARLVMFSMCGPDAVGEILAQSQVFVDQEAAFCFAFDHQFIVLDNVSHSAFIVKPHMLEEDKKEKKKATFFIEGGTLLDKTLTLGRTMLNPSDELKSSLTGFLFDVPPPPQGSAHSREFLFSGAAHRGPQSSRAFYR